MGNNVERCGAGLSAGSCFRPRGRVALRRIGEDRLLVPISGTAAHAASVFPLNETGALIWEQLAQGRSLGQAAEQLARVFVVDSQAALADCMRFAETLLGEDLMEAVEQ